VKPYQWLLVVTGVPLPLDCQLEIILNQIMREDLLLVTKHGNSVPPTTLNRPNALNAMSMTLRNRIVKIFTALDSDDEVQVVF